MSNQDSVVGKLRAKIAFHEGEARRPRGLLDALVKEVGGDMAAVDNPNRFKGMSFITAVTQLLRENGQMTAADIAETLLAGGFVTTSEQPKRNIANMLDQAARRNAFVKAGDRTTGVLWKLPE